MAPQPVGPKAEVRLPPATLAEVDTRAAAAGHARAVELRNLIERGMTAETTAGPQRGCTGGCKHASTLRRLHANQTQRAIDAEHELGRCAAALAVAECLLAKSKTERGATSHNADSAELLGLLRACVPHLPNNRLRQRVQQATT